jgi:ABC-type Fe3+/spermidine/putrescine transport system ATPase subunit
VMEFIGAANSFDGRLTGRSGEIGEIDIAGGGRMRGRIAANVTGSERVALLVRPEKMRLAFSGVPAGDGTIVGTLAHVSHLGFVTHFTVRLGQGLDVLCYRLNDRGEAGSEGFEEGRAVTLSWDPADARIFPAEREV